MIENQVQKTLFDTYQMGEITLSNRIGMAPLTRQRCDPQTGIPNDLLVKYYSERAEAGFMITECAPISNQGNSFPGSAGIWNREQMEGWKKVVDAVHLKGGKIILQIWHAGRAADPSQTGEESLAPSALPMKRFDKEGNATEGPTPKEMTLEDIKLVREQFRQGAIRAKEAGFDGIELQSAGGYLIDEFIRDSANKRTDEYGGSIENRARFCLEIVDELVSIFGKGRVGVKFSPVGRYQSMFDSNPLETYTYLLNKLDERGIAFVELPEPAKSSPYENKTGYIPGEDQIPIAAKAFRGAFKGTLITNQGHTPETALEFINKGWADLVTFGKLYIANPDLVNRIRNGWELNRDWDRATFYKGGEKGYIDYPHFDPDAKKIM